MEKSASKTEKMKIQLNDVRKKFGKRFYEPKEKT